MEQTIFLLEQQKESRVYCGNAFESFLTLIQEKMDAESDKDDKTKLEYIHGAVKNQSDRFTSEIDEDIEFLGGQVKALEAIGKEKDEEKVTKLVDTLMEGQKVTETETFKKEVAQESKQAKEHFLSVMADLATSLKEGGIDDLVVYFEDLIADQNDEEEFEDDDIELLPEEIEETDEKKTECCGGDGSCGDKCVCDNSCGCS